ncbi:MAG: DnaJ domain-containing protein [Oscillospiraceae bacterium]|jgi:tetratricopeptide (TPR) repeat protein|nr:DnaJ domain-containing protein [Oscillospiraceae bacterium]
MNFYETLNVEKTADADEIKRSYFRLVRQFTPEKNPEQFKKIREAYDVLSKADLRHMYDASLTDTSEMAEGAVRMLDTAQELLRRNRKGPALETLETAVKVYPDETKLKEELALAYFEAKYPGKALKLYEALIWENPDHLKYHYRAAECCNERGWKKKALEYAGFAMNADKVNEKYHFQYLSFLCYQAGFTQLVEQCIHSVKEINAHGGKAPNIALFGLSTLLKHRWDMSDDKVLFFSNALASQSKGISVEQQCNLKLALDTFIIRVSCERRFFLFPVLETTIENIGANELKNNGYYDLLKVGYTAQQATQSGIPRNLAALAFLSAVRRFPNESSYDAEDVADETELFEFEVLYYFDFLRPHILRIKQEFPLLYKYAAEFFDSALGNSNTEMNLQLKLRQKGCDAAWERGNGMWLDFDCLGGEDFKPPKQDPRRVECKTKPNEPCPCGSGKKFKKCCAGR